MEEIKSEIELKAVLNKSSGVIIAGELHHQLKGMLGKKLIYDMVKNNDVSPDQITIFLEGIPHNPEELIKVRPRLEDGPDAQTLIWHDRLKQYGFNILGLETNRTRADLYLSKNEMLKEIINKNPGYSEVLDTDSSLGDIMEIYRREIIQPSRVKDLDSTASKIISEQHSESKCSLVVVGYDHTPGMKTLIEKTGIEIKTLGFEQSSKSSDKFDIKYAGTVLDNTSDWSSTSNIFPFWEKTKTDFKSMAQESHCVIL
ncbi:MAG: hypothetical protein EP298_01530 [Gammaproteobacteria bacterium]|nr:MAG: hypothetical protein EP298_01530 [Gammaproteobacteria bacterium]UTW43887.1 hypothetical protein KFE69_07305 [bacterium SCSIO 12844]